MVLVSSSQPRSSSSSENSSPSDVKHGASLRLLLFLSLSVCIVSLLSLCTFAVAASDHGYASHKSSCGSGLQASGEMLQQPKPDHISHQQEGSPVATDNSHIMSAGPDDGTELQDQDCSVKSNYMFLVFSWIVSILISLFLSVWGFSTFVLPFMPLSFVEKWHRSQIFGMCSSSHSCATMGNVLGTRSGMTKMWWTAQKHLQIGDNKQSKQPKSLREKAASVLKCLKKCCQCHRICCFIVSYACGIAFVRNGVKKFCNRCCSWSICCYPCCVKLCCSVCISKPLEESDCKCVLSAHKSCERVRDFCCPYTDELINSIRVKDSDLKFDELDNQILALKNEKERIKKKIDDHLNNPTSAEALVIEGRPGDGKSLLAKYAIAYYQKKNKGNVFKFGKDDIESLESSVLGCFGLGFSSCQCKQCTGDDSLLEKVYEDATKDRPALMVIDDGEQFWEMREPSVPLVRQHKENQSVLTILTRQNIQTKENKNTSWCYVLSEKLCGEKAQGLLQGASAKLFGRTFAKTFKELSKDSEEAVDTIDLFTENRTKSEKKEAFQKLLLDVRAKIPKDEFDEINEDCHKMSFRRFHVFLEQVEATEVNAKRLFKQFMELDTSKKDSS